MLMRSVPDTSEIGSGLSVNKWLTPTASNDTFRPCEGTVRLLRARVVSGATTRAEASLMMGGDVGKAQGKIEKWPTPTVSGNHNRKGSSPKAGDGLATKDFRRHRLPTPSATDWKGSSKPGQRRGQLSEMEAGVGLVTKDLRRHRLPTPLATDVSKQPTDGLERVLRTGSGSGRMRDASSKAGRLNPDWEEAEIKDWQSEHDIPRLKVKVKGDCHRQRLQALGNGWVPQCGAVAWGLLTGG